MCRGLSGRSRKGRTCNEPTRKKRGRVRIEAVKGICFRCKARMARESAATRIQAAGPDGTYRTLVRPIPAAKDMTAGIRKAGPGLVMMNDE
jgi:hypothetical protein